MWLAHSRWVLSSSGVPAADLPIQMEQRLQELNRYLSTACTTFSCCIQVCKSCSTQAARLFGVLEALPSRKPKAHC
jgi:hypothetical protein